VIAESYYHSGAPRWTAKPTEVLRVDCALMGVKLPAGTPRYLVAIPTATRLRHCRHHHVVGLLAGIVASIRIIERKSSAN